MSLLVVSRCEGRGTMPHCETCRKRFEATEKRNFGKQLEEATGMRNAKCEHGNGATTETVLGGASTRSRAVAKSHFNEMRVEVMKHNTLKRRCI